MSKERTDLVPDFLTQNKIITSICISNSFEYVYKITLLEDSGAGAGEGVGGGAGEGGTASLVGQLCLGRGCRVFFIPLPRPANCADGDYFPRLLIF